LAILLGILSRSLILGPSVEISELG
jgi:hypothetical protein